MSWFASSPNEAEVSKEHYYPFNALDIDLPSGHLRLWTGIGDLTIDGVTYQGLAGIGDIDGETESAELGKQRRTYTLSGVDPALIDEDDIDYSFGRSSIEYLGFLNPETIKIIDTPEISFEGRIDSFGRTDGETPTVRLIVEHRLAVMDLVDGWRYTNEDQQEFYPGDKGLDQVNNTALKKVLWGGYPVYPGARDIANGPGGGGGGGNRRYQR